MRWREIGHTPAFHLGKHTGWAAFIDGKVASEHVVKVNGPLLFSMTLIDGRTSP